jgi:hypothetical protein
MHRSRGGPSAGVEHPLDPLGSPPEPEPEAEKPGTERKPRM